MVVPVSDMGVQWYLCLGHGSMVVPVFQTWKYSGTCVLDMGVWWYLCLECGSMVPVFQTWEYGGICVSDMGTWRYFRHEMTTVLASDMGKWQYLRPGHGSTWQCLCLSHSNGHVSPADHVS